MAATGLRPVVIVPTYNERDNLPLLIPALLQTPALRILVVDDNSPDGTGEVAAGLARQSGGRVEVLHRKGRRGLGLSYIEGMRRVLAGDATHICQMDADLSHHPSDVPRLLEATGEADLVIGSRYVQGGRIENWGVHRMLLSGFANQYVRLITGLPPRDNTSGFRCWRREALQQVPLDRIASDGYAFLVELVWEAARAGCRIREIPITFSERRQGASKLSTHVIFESIRLPWRLAARGRLSGRTFRATI
jgi:dolichol-phosphate mannosyltransferase